MNIKLLSMLALATISLAACDESLNEDGTTETFDKFLAAIEYNDPNLQTCVESTIKESDYKESSKLEALSCDVEITDAKGLEAFSNLQSLNLETAGMTCEALNTVQAQLLKSASGTDDETPVVVIQQSECFYNSLEFSDDNFRACVLADFNENNWASVEELTTLICNDSAIRSVAGVEVFTNLAELDIAQTTVACAEVVSLIEQGVSYTIVNPLVCEVSNIVFSADVAECVANNTPASGLTIDFTELTCANSDELEIIDISGLDKLTSLTLLNLEDTSADCEQLSQLGELLVDAEILTPADCQLTNETLLSEMPKPYAHLDGEGNIVSYEAFADPKLLSCFNANVSDNGWTTIGEVVSFTCGAGDEPRKSDERGIGSIAGMENLIALETASITHSIVTDFTPLYELENYVYFNFPYNKIMTDETLAAIAGAIGPQITHLSLAGTDQVTLAGIDAFAELIYLNLTLKKLTFNLETPDWGNLEKLQKLQTLIFKANYLENLEPLLCRGDETCTSAKTFPYLQTINIEKIRQKISAEWIYPLACSEVDALVAAYPEADIMTDGETCS